CQQNPWDVFAEKYQKGDRISGNIKSITDFGIFIGLEGDIDGLVHLSDISWDEPGEQAVRQYTKGDKIETVILSIDPERERISLGIKQLSGDPFVNYVSSNEKGSIVKGTVKSVDAKEAVITLTEGVEGILKASEISRDRVEDARNVLKEGDTVELMITNVDRKNRVLGLSIKAREIGEEKESVKEHNSKQSATVGATTVGDLIKAKMNKE
ncbi:MAG: S1 RNA-binding domain-containing protein, partial [Pseudomonadota bacterium]|nr:S1 RNA-binding domain-containing protein [Pseudomonadota bacterium]